MAAALHSDRRCQCIPAGAIASTRVGIPDMVGVVLVTDIAALGSWVLLACRSSTRASCIAETAL